MSRPAEDPPRTTAATGVLDATFRHHWGRLVAALLRVFGPARLDLVEDVVQEAMLEATRHWSVRGVPARPDAWLLRVARNRAVDVLRRQRRARTEPLGADTEPLGADTEPLGADAEAPADQRAADRLFAADPDPFGGGEDDGLTLVFLCCHPALPVPARVALTLKTVCGLGVAEIAAALLDKEATVAQRLSRAKARLQREGARFEMPRDPAEFELRYATVLEVLYLLFNEGYRAHRTGPELCRDDLVADALRLTDLLSRHERTDRPETHALLALQLFCGARIPARVDPRTGAARTLAQQDRGAWRRDWIERGFRHFGRSIGGPRLTPWHVEAAIASVHACAPTYADTDWRTILSHYDRLVALRPGDPVVALNRVVALAKIHGPAAALAALDAVEGHPRLADYALLHATRGQLLWQEGRTDAAAAALERARALARTEPETRLLAERLAACRAGAAPLPL